MAQARPPAGMTPATYGAALKHAVANGHVKKAGSDNTDTGKGRKIFTKEQGNLDWIRKNFGEDVIITENETRVNVALNGTQMAVQVNQDTNGNKADNTQNLLDKNDMMVADRVGFFLGQQAQFQCTTGATVQTNKYVQGQGYTLAGTQKLTYPDPTLLDPNITLTDTTGHQCGLQNFWGLYESSVLNISINTKVLYKTLFVRDSLYVPVTQKYSVTAAATPIAASAAASPVSTYTPDENQRLGPKDGYQELQTMLLLSGAGQNDITFNIPNSTNGAVAYNFQPYNTTLAALTNNTSNIFLQNAGFFIFKGWIVKNITYQVGQGPNDVINKYYGSQQ